MRCWRLSSFSLWLDEILQVYWVQGTWKFFWSSLRFDAVHPPLDYLVTRALNALQPADWVRKLPSVLWGTLSIAAAAELLRRRVGAGAGLGAAALLAFAPFHIRYSQELRPYSLGLFLICLSLLALEAFLARPSWPRLAGLYLASLAAAYTLYLAAVVLALAAAALLLDDAFSPEPGRRLAARRFLRWSPLFLLALVLAYVPWIPVVMEAARRPAAGASPPMTLERLATSLSFFTFATDDGQPLHAAGAMFLVVAGIGLVLAVRDRSTRFLAAWLLAGCIAIEALEHLHPHNYATRHFLAAGMTLPMLTALALVRLFRIDRWRAVATLGIALTLAADLVSLGDYYRDGRPDWRTLAEYLAARPPSERIFTENQWSQLCVAYYLVGPEFLYRRSHTTPEVLSLDGEAIRLAWSWKPGTTAWLVLAGNPRSEQLRTWSGFFPALSFPRAEAATLRRLDPSLWGQMATSVPKPVPKP